MKNLIVISLFFLFGLFVSCSNQETKENNLSVLQYVDPFIGTGGHVHTFPGATLPFGMIQLSPDGDITGWDWCSGYHYSDSSLMGFSHTHLSGTGWSDLGDILLMPTTGNVLVEPGSKENPDLGYRSRFSHEKESASPGFYQVFLEDYGIHAELTCTERVGYHKYRFPAGSESNIIIDPEHKIFYHAVDNELIIEGNRVKGVCHSTGWGGDRSTYFVAEFSKAFQSFGTSNNGVLKKESSHEKGLHIKAWLQFNTKEDEEITVKVALSPVSYEGALKNLEAEAKNKSFEEVLSEAREKWADKLNRIEVKDGSDRDKTIFYTALYHNFIAPNLYMDVDSMYWALGQKLKAQDFSNYSTFSLWDTFRATHPLLNIIDQETSTDFANSLISRHRDADGTMPVWELCGYDNTCMIGYHSSSMIWDALVKGVPGIDKKEAFEAMYNAGHTNKISSSDGAGGITNYDKLGFVPDMDGKSVSKTLEFAYNDWCTASLAKELGYSDKASRMFERSASYKNLFQEDKRRFWPKNASGEWLADFKLSSWDVLQPHYISGNFWAYEYFVPHALEDLIDMKGGREAFEKELDAMLANDTPMEGEQHVDISGFIGKYGHGDEPGHHIPYLFNYTDNPWKSQQLINKIRTEMYSDQPDGMVNNEDCGQMSAWYIFSALGYYPVCPGKAVYDLGSPLFKEVVIHLENGKDFRIKANKENSEYIYLKRVLLNGKEIDGLFLDHEEMMKGGCLEFELSTSPK